MSDDRTRIFAAISDALKTISEPTAYPEYEPAVMVSPVCLGTEDAWEAFCRNHKAVNGRSMRTVAEVAKFLEENGWKTGYCDPALKESVGDALGEHLTVEYVFDEARVNDYQFGITRGSGIIVESGTIILKDRDTVCRLGALAPWVHVAVVEEAAIFRTIPEGVAGLGDDPNIIWMTGPSKTADVEGILIEGVHGPGEQICLMLEDAPAVTGETAQPLEGKGFTDGEDGQQNGQGDERDEHESRDQSEGGDDVGEKSE